jgi:nucleotide-binding universal stress UspA family protein
MFRKILIALDHSTPAADAAKFGSDLAAKSGAEVVLLTVVPPPPGVIPDVAAAGAKLDYNRSEGRRLLDRYRRLLPHNTLVEELVFEGSPPDEIVSAALSCHADLVVLGTHSRHGLSRVFLGSTAEAVVRNSPCTVLVVRQPQEAAPAAHLDRPVSGASAA